MKMLAVSLVAAQVVRSGKMALYGNFVHGSPLFDKAILAACSKTTTGIFATETPRATPIDDEHSP
ncbi:MAG TPA: hypothetical protein PK280_09765 [Planctomycetota bacterium]|nr:hypothetical protein [Planctomycetota bacterium]